MIGRQQGVKNRAKLKNALPGTLARIEARTGLSMHTVWRWVKLLRNEGEAHIGSWERNTTRSGPHCPIFRKGAGEDVPCPFAPLTNSEKLKRSRANQRADGRYERHLAVERARYYSKKAEKRGDPLVMMFFGKQSQQQKAAA